MSNQQTSLAAAITTAGQASITVTDFLGFPASGAYSILIDAELLRVTAGNGTTTWTVTRGYQGTTAVTHLNAATITYAPDAYAELGDTIARMSLDGTARYGLILDMLVEVSRDIDKECLRTFAVPTADVTFYCDTVCWSSSLAEAIGRPITADGRALDLVSITTLSVRDSETSSYTTIAAGDTGYYLESAPNGGAGVAGTDWPYEDVTLSPGGTSYVQWPIGKRSVKIVGKPGWPAIHPSVSGATITEVVERFRQSVGGGPSPIGVTGFGTPIFLTGDSHAMRRITQPPFSRRNWAA